MSINTTTVPRVCSPHPPPPTPHPPPTTHHHPPTTTTHPPPPPTPHTHTPHPTPTHPTPTPTSTPHPTHPPHPSTPTSHPTHPPPPPNPHPPTHPHPPRPLYLLFDNQFDNDQLHIERNWLFAAQFIELNKLQTSSRCWTHQHRHLTLIATYPFKKPNAIFSCDQAALQMVFSVCPSVRLSVRLSVCPSHLFDYVPIIVSSCNFQELLPMTNVRSMQKVKVRGQRSRSQRSQPNLTVSGL